MVEFPVGHHDSLNWNVTRASRDWSREAIELLSYIRRGVEKKPALPVHADRHGGLAGRNGAIGCCAGSSAGRTPAVPLRKSPTSGCTKQNNVHGDSRRARSHGPLIQLWLE